MKMNLYAIRDRLVDYYMIPFPAPDHAHVKAAVAQQVNNGDTNAITQAPQHFEIHQLAEIDTESGTITPKREFVCECSLLIRRNLREEHGPGNGATDEDAHPGTGKTGGT